jgi:hypothetical protein
VSMGRCARGRERGQIAAAVDNEEKVGEEERRDLKGEKVGLARVDLLLFPFDADVSIGTRLLDTRGQVAVFGSIHATATVFRFIRGGIDWLADIAI